MAQWTSIWNNNPLVRWGVNAMYSIDGFTGSMMASGNARTKAFQELFDKSSGAFNKADFEKLQKKLYDEAFDANGVLTDKAAKFATSEVALNLDSEVVKSLQVMMDSVPVLKSIFLFPRTGVNAVELAWSFTPTSRISQGATRAGRLFKAKTQLEIKEVLAEHGITEYSLEALQALRSEHTGRQIMGSSLIAGVMLLAVNGGITGNGPQDAAERIRMIKKMGFKPLHIKNPFTGTWHSYKGFEPFAGIMGLAADLAFHSTRIDQAPMEDILNKMAVAVSMNLTNATFLSGFEPLVGLLSNDETAWNRFLANTTNSMIPGAGARSILNNIVTPQIKDVKNEFWHQLANKNKFLFPGDEFLKDSVDLYTNEPIRYHEPLTAAVNAFLPAFKSNGGTEPWRQWLLETGWDNLQILQTNPLNSEPIEPKAQQWINTWIAEHYPLAERIEEMRTHPKGYWDKKLKEYVKGRGDLTQNEFPIEKSVVHVALDNLHRKARKAAWEAYKRTLAGETQTLEGAYKNRRDLQLKKGDITGARETTDEILDIIDITK